MSNVIQFATPSRSSQPSPAGRNVTFSSARTTADYRRLLSELRLRPATQRAFLRKFLKRAAANGVLVTFSVQIPAVLTS
jgi:hypothetical protein